MKEKDFCSTCLNLKERCVCSDDLKRNPVEQRVSRPSGFRGKKTDKFLRKDSAYGQKYFCNSCGKTALGTNFMDDKHHHWKWCEWMKAD